MGFVFISVWWLFLDGITTGLVLLLLLLLFMDKIMVLVVYDH